jgi:putative spermidine/putrescine transport system permease protein
MTREIPLAFRIVAWALLVALAAPLALIAIMSFNSSASLAFPPHGVSLRWYAKILTTRSFIVGFGFSAVLAVASTAVSVTIGTATAFALVRYRFVGRAFINMLVMAPLIIPEVVMGVALLIWFSASRLGLGTVSLLFLHTLVVLPYIVRILVASLQRIDLSLEQAAMLLGAPPWLAVTRVTLPLIRKAIAAAALFGVVISFQNFTASLFLISGTPTLPIAIFDYIRTENDPAIAALSTLMIGALAFVVWFANRAFGLERVI